MAFFRVILPATLQEKKLKLPVKFATLHGGKLTESARLSLPNGRFWDVRVVKGPEEGIMWFDDEEWSRFVEENSVSEYWILGFKYTGTSSFKVRIFDLTTCEISYPSRRSDNADENDEPSVEILSSSPFSAVEERDDSVQILPSPQPVKKKKNNNDTTPGDDELGRRLVDDLKARGIFCSQKLSWKLPAWSMEIKNAVQEAMAMQSGNSPSFLAVMQPHNSAPHDRLLVPKEFVQKHMKKAGTVTVTLKLSRGEGCEWQPNTSFTNRRLYLAREFGKFYRDNGLKDGDVCLFEMISNVNGNVVFQVSISRAGLNA